MAMVVWIVSAIAGLYGLGWFVFAFVNPPSAFGYLYRSPAMFYFLSERGGRLMMGAICVALSIFASTVVPLFWKG
jgi:hypothetical protein